MFIRILSPLALLLASPALAACPAIVLTKQVEQALDEAQAQLDDADAVHAGVEHVRELLPCARMPLPASTAARLHVLVALDEAEPPAPTLAARLQAARLADPELSLPRLPPRLANVTPLWEHALDTPPEPARAASDADLGTVLALLDADGSMRLDGRVGTDRPPDRRLALSADHPRGAEPDWPAAGRWARAVLDQLLAAHLPARGRVVKVEIPFPAGTARGVRITGCGLTHPIEDGYVEKAGPADAEGRLFQARWVPARDDLPGTDTQELA